jgi:hypothetical protein
MISAFCNPVDPERVNTYAQMTLYSEPPAIHGYPSIIDERDVGNYFMDDVPITEDDIGHWVWYVTDGHHRTCAAVQAGINLFVELDPSCEIQMRNTHQEDSHG